MYVFFEDASITFRFCTLYLGHTSSFSWPLTHPPPSLISSLPSSQVHYIQVFYSLVFLFIYLVKHGHRWPYFLAAIYAPSYFIPLQRLGGWPFKGFMRRPFWRCVQRTLALQVEREVELSPDEQYIFGWHPCV